VCSEDYGDRSRYVSIQGVRKRSLRRGGRYEWTFGVVCSCYCSSVGQTPADNVIRKALDGC
jgi:hypothetical protein